MATRGTDPGHSNGGGEGDEDNIQVFVRIRPPCKDEPGYMRVVDVDDSNTQVLLRQEPNPRKFSFDHVADIDSKQEEIFSKLGKKVIDNCIAGYNGTIFAYGQTGSGKTFTMMGPSEDSDNFQHELRGVIPRSFEYLYNRIAREKELHGDTKQFLCKCSFLEIYKEQIFDLLEPSTVPLHLRESFKTGVYVAGLSEKVVADACEAYEVLSSSWVNRKVASTAMNRESSRSHAVFTLQIEIKEPKTSGAGNLKTSCLNLVDLAGSERQKDTGACGIRLKEAGSINKSLSNLGNVIMALVSVSRERKERYIPYRDSKLTFLLRDSLGGNAKTRVIACVHPGHKCFPETLSTLLFAKRAKMIKNKAVLNENAYGDFKQMQALIKSLQAEIKMLKEARPTVVQVAAQPSTSLAECMPVLREMFLQAMFLRQRSESEKQELHGVIEKLQDVCEKKDKAIQTKKMIIKFRDNAIKRMEEKLKGADIPIIEQLQEDLVQERDLLQAQVEQHPQVAKYALDVQRLKSKIKTLKEDSGILSTLHKDSEKIRLLEDEYHQIITDQQDIKEEKEITPQRADAVSTATVEKLRSQVADMESQLEQLRSDNSETKQKAEKNELYKDGEIASYKKTVEELEKVLAANNIRSKLEKDALNEQHLHTVMTITTPKKECYKLRNRTVITTSDTPNLDDTIPFESEKTPDAPVVPEEEGILHEDIPEEVAQQANEALIDQIKQLQEKNASLESRLGEYEADRIKQSHKQSVVESQVKSMEELLEKEEQAMNSLQEQLNQVEPRLKAAIEEREHTFEHNQDLKLILAQTDKDLKENRDKVKALELEKKTRIEDVESKMADLYLIIEKNTKDIEKKGEENDRLENALEEKTFLGEYHESQIQVFEKQVLELREENQKLQQNLQNAEKTILEEKEHRESLVGQLSNESDEKDCELVMRIDESKALKEECLSMQNLLDENDNTIDGLRKDVKDRDMKCSNLEKTLKGIEEKAGQYCIRLEEVIQQKQDLDEKLLAACEEKDFLRTREESQLKQLEELKTKVVETQEELDRGRSKHSFQIEMLNEDLRTQQENTGEINQEYMRSQEALQQSADQCRKLAQEVENLKLTLKEKEEAVKNEDSLKLETLTETLHDLERSRLESKQENMLLKNQLVEVKDKYQTTWMELESVQSELQFSQERVESRHTQITELEARCFTAEAKASNVERELNQAQIGFVESQTKLTETEVDRNELKKENDQLQETRLRLMGLAENDNNAIMSLKNELGAMKDRLKDLCQHFGSSEVEGYVFDLEDLVHGIQTMRDENKQLTQQNNELIGHSNHKQKIRFHEKVKDENISLKKELQTLQEKHRRVQNELKLSKGSNIQLREQNVNVLKENKMPQCKPFLSGNYDSQSASK